MHHTLYCLLYTSYDQFGHAAFDGGAGGSGGFDFNNFDFGDIFGGSGFGDIFGDLFGGGGRRGPSLSLIHI